MCSDENYILSSLVKIAKKFSESLAWAPVYPMYINRVWIPIHADFTSLTQHEIESNLYLVTKIPCTQKVKNHKGKNSEVSKILLKILILHHVIALKKDGSSKQVIWSWSTRWWSVESQYNRNSVKVGDNSW